ncbi:putative xanthine dehydrogenase [Diaporthe ampelina]|uniref:xanthine dehydrogenase n=1 Tax=Diaporthe ampelina TaxID=1214573 RepID=A0A0G2FHC4_9PEZI|nr:putative xanthine dehydrogenase [Diaporthe ampelina]
MAKMHGSQCGFCTPGIVMSLYGLVRNAWDPDEGVFRLNESAPSPGTSVSSQGNLKSNPVLELGGTVTTQPDHYDFQPYQPGTDLIFPPSLWKHERKPICYGDSSILWFRPTTLAQLLEIKSIYPPAKIVSGASEVAIEQRFKLVDYPVMVYVGDIDELRGSAQVLADATDTEWQSLDEVVLPANVPLTEVERLCKEARAHIGKRGQVLGALRKQLRYFGGRQIRNVATLAGNIATASPISDALPVLMASGASVTIGRLDKDTGSLLEEVVPLSKFLKGYRRTTLTEEMQDGVLSAIRIPLPPLKSRGNEFIKAYKQAKRKEDDIAIVTACFHPSTLEKAIDSLQKELWLPFDVPGGMAQYRTTLACSLFLRFWHESLRDLGIVGELEANVSELEHGVSFGTRDIPALPANIDKSNASTMGRPVPHLSSLAQTTGQAEYVDDIPPQSEELFCGLVLSTRSHARIISVDWSAALESPGVVGHMDHHSLSSPDLNLWGSLKHDEPFFATETVDSHGQVIGVVLADTQLGARAAARKVKIEYEDLPAVITIDQAIQARSFFPYGKELRKGDSALKQDLSGPFAACDRVFEGTTRLGGQEQFYLETNAALAIPKSEDGQMDVWSSTQNTMETQTFVSQILTVPNHKINVRVKRLGGGFGGKESRSVPIACYCALAAAKHNRPVRIMLTREEDMATSGQRHPFKATWRIGVTNAGKLMVLEADLYNNAGFSVDMSTAVMDRALTHVDNCYEIPDVWVRGHVCKTNTHSNTAFRGFGGPQGMFITESIISAVAEGLDVPVDEIRRRNLYVEGQRTPFLQHINEDWHVPTMLEQVRRNAQFDARKEAIDAYNSDPKNRWRKKGIAMIPTKFGLSFATALHLNQAAAYVQIYTDGTVLLSHGGTEMGQGLYTKMCQVASAELGVPLRDVYTNDSSTYSIANASPTAASSGSDLNGMAVKAACEKLRERLNPYRQELGEHASMKELAMAAYRDRVSLIASGFWKMPRIGYIWNDFENLNPKPMYYYWTQGVAVTEVELDVLTGDHHDVGNSINPALDYGQIEGAFVQGQGLFTLEESLWNSKTGCLSTTGPGTYKIPGFGDIPREFNVSMLKNDTEGNPISWKHLRSIASSKGVGEPPLFLGSTVFFALRDAVRAARKENGLGDSGLVLDSPATAEALRCAVGDQLSRKCVVDRVEGQKSFFHESRANMSHNNTSPEEPLPEKEGLETAKLGKASQDTARVVHLEHFENEDASQHKARTTRLLRKIDLHLLPFLIVMYLLNFLDRSNLAQARQGSLEADLNMKGTDFNLATSIFFVGYLLMQLPSNMLITRVQPRVYLSSAMVLWGLVSTCNAAAHSFGALVAIRFFLGFVEAPFFPGAIFLMSSWFVSQEGTITIGIAILSGFFLPNYPATTPWLTDEEKHFAAWRLLADINEEDERHASSTMAGLKLALVDYRLYLFVLLQHVSLLSQTFQYFFPSIVGTLGATKFATFLVSIFVTWTSSRTKDRSIHIVCLMLVAAVGNAIATGTTNIGARFFAMFLMPMGAVSAYQIIVSWVANSFPRPLVKRSISIAIANMIGNTASIYGSYMYPATASPRYIPGGTSNTVMCLMVALLALVLRFVHMKENKELERLEERELADDGQAGNEGSGNRRATGFRYVY